MKASLRATGLLFLPGLVAGRAAAAAPSAGSPGETVALPSARDSVLSTIMGSPAWADLREAWTQMTAVAQPGSGDFYAGVIDAEKAETLRTRITGDLEILAATAPASAELSLLGRLCMLRIQGMLFGSRSMMTRMIMPAVMQDAEMSLLSFERRLDAIEDLRSRGLMGSIESAEAVRAAFDTAAAALLLDVLATPRIYTYSLQDPLPEPSWALVQIRLEELRAFYDTSGTISSDQRLSIDGAIAETDSIRALLPGLGTLLTDLVLAR